MSKVLVDTMAKVVDHGFNRVDITIQFPEDKWMGLLEWSKDVELLEAVLHRLFPVDRRGEVSLSKSWQDMEDK